MKYRRDSTILVVDNFRSHRLRLISELRDHGYMVKTTNDGKQALEMFIASPAALVLTNTPLRSMNGVQLVRALKRVSPETPVIIFAPDSILKKHYPKPFARANAFFEKPIDMDELLLCVDELLGFSVR